ncbi:hypothetical protein COCON_G00160370 [Conger conger]|uniref:Uncharacterized protein n=1 Tax=Conger conger TaxID=82655 RepID=A0A9Q1DA65_CONCO|nr:hypothetical protein COCON_G00160370 [Conger conger]
MASSLKSWSSVMLNALAWVGPRGFHSTAVCCKNRAARIRVGKGDKPLTYERALHPHHIAHRKGWLSQHTSNLDGESGAADRIVEDVFIRRFMYGTFINCLTNELVIKRRGTYWWCAPS